MKKLAFLIVMSLTGLNILSGQTIVISGTVTSSVKGEGTIPGVAVQVKGTTTGSLTDAYGKYSISVPRDATTLVFSFLGMKTQEVAISGRTKIDVILEPTVQEIPEVVVTALGISRE